MKHILLLFLLVNTAILTACSTNPATGENQLSFLGVSQEKNIGAQQHSEIIKSIGLIDNAQLSQYVQSVGQKLVPYTERAEINYRFFVLDTPMVNAFALPGGYIYVTRGILSLAKNEAELAAVLAHEIGHVTARHASERYSHGVLSAIGATALAVATNSQNVAQLAGLGSELYIKSYSRSQEFQADELGIRYLHKAGYNTFALPKFLRAMELHTALEASIYKMTHKPQASSYFSTHPNTSDRIDTSLQISGQYPSNQNIFNTQNYLSTINGMIYGNSEKHGFTIYNTFYHPELGFKLQASESFAIINQPSQIIMTNGNSVILFDIAQAKFSRSAAQYVVNEWIQRKLNNQEEIVIHNKPAFTGEYSGVVNGKNVNIRVIAVQWAPGVFYRFQIAIPYNVNSSELNEIKRVTYSLQELTSQERRSVTPLKIKIIKAQSQDTIQNLANKMPFNDLRIERFKVLNQLYDHSELKVNEPYKIVVY